MKQSLNLNPKSQNITVNLNNTLKQYRSLRVYLILCFSGLIIIIGTLTALGVYHSTRKEALSLQNHNLQVIAQLILKEHQTITPMYSDGPKVIELHPVTSQKSKSLKHSVVIPTTSEIQEAQIIIPPIYFSPKTNQNDWLKIPATIPNGLSNLESHGEAWQILVSATPNGQRFVVGQRAEVRNELAENTSLRMLIPLVVLLPVLILVITLVVRQSFKPIEQLASHIDQQKDGVSLPLDHLKIPREILPFVYSINQLLARLSQSMSQQRRFIADAAHELRTPLTALTLQAENLNRIELSTEDRERVHQLQRGLLRSQNLLEQLLSLARQQSGVTEVITRISLLTAIKESLIDCIPLALQKNIDLGVVQQEDVWVDAVMQDIQMILRNAISNAIRYTPIGGCVDIRIYSVEKIAFIEITDTGSGIPETELTRVFDPFYRVLGQVETGSGLGLTIIQEITNRYIGQVNLRNREDQSGLCFELQMPVSERKI
jgi:two-component system OmpR family sensor kinase